MRIFEIYSGCFCYGISNYELRFGNGEFIIGFFLRIAIHAIGKSIFHWLNDIKKDCFTEVKKPSGPQPAFRNENLKVMMPCGGTECIATPASPSPLCNRS